jgi:COP9 signalosome complex subunit 5
MSGIDCSTQMLNQQYQEPWLAVIIDPIRTCAAGKVEIGAFRTYPEGYKPPETGPSEYQTIPQTTILKNQPFATQSTRTGVSVCP